MRTTRRRFQISIGILVIVIVRIVAVRNVFHILRASVTKLSFKIPPTLATDQPF
jgi:hypothetical protein